MFDEKSWKAQQHPLRQLTDDIWQLRLPLPYALDHVNVYLIQGDSGWTLLDAGLNISRARTLWEGVCNKLGIGPHNVEQIVITHVHPDHFGLAGWLQQKFSTAERQTPVLVSAEEHAFFNELWVSIGDPSQLENSMSYYVQNGIPLEQGEAVWNATISTGHHTMPHPTFQPIPAEGELKMGNRTWRVIHAPGHADGQIIFYDPKDRLFLSGDQLLMKITPNVGAWPNSKVGVLQRYLGSLHELRAYDVRLAYPGHKWLIEDWQKRIDEMIAHHDDRLDHTLGAVKATVGITVNEVSKIVFRLGDLDIHQARFAVAETLAHLDLLQARGLIQRELQAGVWRYRVG